MKNIEKYKDIVLKNLNHCKMESDLRKLGCKAHIDCEHTFCEDCKETFFKWLLSEYKEPSLNKAERKYLSDVIRPFRKSVTYISKLPFSETDKQFISIVVMNERGRRECVNLPNFEVGTMYKGMKPNKPYKLEELGL